MKSKTIIKILRERMDAWLESIEDQAVRDLVAKNSIITGGCIASMLLREKVNDFDIYFRNLETAKAVAEYYVARFKPKTATGIEAAISVEVDESVPPRVKIKVKSAGIASEEGTAKPYEYFETSTDVRTAGYVAEVMGDPGDIEDRMEQTEKLAQQAEDDDGLPKFRPVFMSTNAITLSNRVQVVLRFYGEAEQIHANYDFVHCTNYWTSHDNKLVLHPEALEALLAKELRYQGSKYPVCSVFRLRKFITRGWTVNAGQILKMLMQVSKLDLEDPVVLEDQLTGVDCAYFADVLARLKERDPTKINTAYLIEIIDRMF